MLTLIEGAGLLFWYSFIGVPVGLFCLVTMRKPGEPRIKYPVRLLFFGALWPLVVALVAIGFVCWCLSSTDKSLIDWWGED